MSNSAQRSLTDDLPVLEERLDAKRDVLMRRVLWKLDLRVLPIILLLFFLGQINRTNISGARVAGLEKDLGLVGDQFNISLAIFYVPYILAELPSNLFLKKVGANRWLPFIITMCGVCGMCIGFVQNYAGLLAARVVLGIFNGGILTGVTLYLSMLYQRHELQKRAGLTFAVTCFYNVIGGPLTFGIIKMDGVGGLAGWRWIFILEGLVAITIAPLTSFLLPADISSAKFLNDAEKEVAVEFLRGRTIQEARQSDLQEDGLPKSGDIVPDEEKNSESAEHQVEIVAVVANEEREQFEWYEVHRALRDPQLWMTGLAAFGIVLNAYSLQYFVPTILQGLGYKGNEVQLRSGPPYVPAIFIVIFISYLTDMLKMRGPFILVTLLANISGYLLLILASSNTQRYVGVFLAASGGWTSYACITTLLVNNMSGHYKRATAGAVQSILAHVGALSAQFIYTSDEAPRFIRGHTVALVFAFVAWACILANIYYCLRENKARAIGGRDDNITIYQEMRDAEKTRAPIGDRHPDFRFVL